ncbi:MAG: YceI family protein [Acidobacteria bacterium]|jgi:polyisoprenoid-binding protein YceI|nr:YceI family protein [Acidobacteriota bacterium]
MKTRFLYLGMMFAVFALALVSFNTSGENLREKEFAAKFADTKLTAAETTGSYDIDPKHSYIGFRVTHMGLAEVPGAFRDFSGSINYDGKDVSKSSVNFTAKVTSVDTGVAPRDTHLRTADFFEVEKYPDMTFKSTKVEKKGDKWEVTGDFTLKGVTKQITIPFTVNGLMKDQKGNVKMGISAQTIINRQDYGVKYGNKLPDGTLALSDMVKIDLQLEAGMMKK